MAIDPTSSFSLVRSGTSTSVAAKAKAADPSIILFDDATYPAVVMEKLLFEDIAGQELLSIVRNDNIAGGFVSDSIISNLSDIALKYNSSNIIHIPDSLPSYFRNFAIDIVNKIPKESNVLSQGLVADAPNVYFDYDINSVVIELNNLEPDEQVEINTLTSADVFNDTIYVDYSSTVFSI